MLHDRTNLGNKKIDYEFLVELFIRNSLQIPSTSRVKQYFEEDIVAKSAISDINDKRPRTWSRFYNVLKKTA